MRCGVHSQAEDFRVIKTSSVRSNSAILRMHIECYSVSLFQGYNDAAAKG